MFARRFLIVSTLAFAIAPAVQSFAQETPAPDVANAPYQFAGEVTANNTFVRSGPREGDYATLKLDSGDKVTVVGIKFDWLKILPPEGSFSYVSKAFVQQYGDGRMGKVTKNDLSVRAGSSLNALKSQVQTKLMDGDVVEIIDQQDEYFKIKPPAGAYLYVKKDFVRPLRPVNGGATDATPTPPTPNGVEQTDATTVVPDAGVDASTDVATPDAGTQTPAVATTTASAAAGEKFNALETKYRESASLPVDQQPIDEMAAGYTELAKGTDLPESMRRIAKNRADSLAIRKQARDELLAVRKEHEEMQARRQSLVAEQQEIEQHLQANAIEVYTAVGTLRASSLQRGAGRLYRLTDPQSGRTLVYLRSDDPATAGLIGQFVGARGTTSTEPQFNMTIITPQVLKLVDVNQVGKGVVAQIMPPGLSATTAAPAGE